MLLPDFTFFDVSCKFFHKLLSFHPVDNRLFIFSTVAKKCLAVQTQGHSCNKNSKRQIFPTWYLRSLLRHSQASVEMLSALTKLAVFSSVALHFHIASTSWSDLRETGMAVFLSIIRHCIYNFIITSLRALDRARYPVDSRNISISWFVLCKFGLFFKFTSLEQIEQCLSDNVSNALLQWLGKGENFRIISLKTSMLANTLSGSGNCKRVAGSTMAQLPRWTCSGGWTRAEWPYINVQSS